MHAGFDIYVGIGAAILTALAIGAFQRHPDRLTWASRPSW